VSQVNKIPLCLRSSKAPKHPPCLHRVNRHTTFPTCPGLVWRKFNYKPYSKSNNETILSPGTRRDGHNLQMAKSCSSKLSRTIQSVSCLFYFSLNINTKRWQHQYMTSRAAVEVECMLPVMHRLNTNIVMTQ
jgi:hypothetical protein